MKIHRTLSERLMTLGAVVLFVLVGIYIPGCSPAPPTPPPDDPPHPDDAGFIDWMKGQPVGNWTIDPTQVSGFKVLRLDENPETHIYTASVSFRATYGSKGIQMDEALIRYKRGSQANTGVLVDFVPVKWSRIGND